MWQARTRGSGPATDIQSASSSGVRGKNGAIAPFGAYCPSQVRKPVLLRGIPWSGVLRAYKVAFCLHRCLGRIGTYITHRPLVPATALGFFPPRLVKLNLPLVCRSLSRRYAGSPACSTCRTTPRDMKTGGPLRQSLLSDVGPVHGIIIGSLFQRASDFDEIPPIHMT